MARGPTSRVGVVPCREALRHAYFDNLTGGRMSGTSWIPEKGSGGPRPGVLVVKIGTGG